MPAAAPLPCHPIRLEPGADLRGALEALAQTLPGSAGFVVSGIGSLGDAWLRLAGASEATLVPGPVEILTLAGTVTRDGAHLHVSVADAAGRVWGGHVGRGNRVLTTVELLIVETPGWDLARTFDPTTGYTELVVKASER